MTNPANAIRMLITYAICIPAAILVGYLLTDPLDYGTLGLFALIALILLSPLVIKWHYPLLVFGLSAPIYCFFLKGNPPLGQVAVLLSLGIATIDRAINSEKRFISVPAMTWPLLYTIAMAYATAKLTGGIGLHTLGGDLGGGKKYIALFIGAATYFAFSSRTIPKNKRNLYLFLFFMPGALGVISDLFPYLPSPLNYVNLLIPPSTMGGGDSSTTRLGALAGSAGVGINYMLAKYGLRGIFRVDKPIRPFIVMTLGVLTLFGGFRIILITYIMIVTTLFFLEGLHRTKMVMVFSMLIVVCMSLLVPFAGNLPFSFQRALTVIPFLKLDPAAIIDADGSKQWREAIWHDTWPKVPQYLLLGKGYALTAQDYAMMGNGQFANGLDASLDKSQDSLAISMDYHNGPLSTLMPFGIWGMISFLWIAAASFWCTYRNFLYGDPELKTLNTFLMVQIIIHIVGYFFIFGNYCSDVGQMMQIVGFSVAMNWGVRAPKPRPVTALQTKPMRAARPLPA